VPALRELQLAFAAAVLRRDDAPDAALHPAGESRARRLGVYRVNARENFAAALESAYPALRAQMGVEEFRSLAWSYQQRHPSPAGNLFEVGRQLPGFLGGALAGTERERWHALARLEWAVQEAMVAADAHTRFDGAQLAAVPASAHAALRFRLHPSVRIVRTAHAVFDDWQAVHERGAPDGAGAATGPERILVRRAADGVELFRLDELDCRCLECLLAGGSLGEMTDAALALEPAPDVAAVLARWARRGVVVGLVLPGAGA
jgi:hypothetical protein